MHTYMAGARVASYSQQSSYFHQHPGMASSDQYPWSPPLSPSSSRDATMEEEEEDSEEYTTSGTEGEELEERCDRSSTEEAPSSHAQEAWMEDNTLPSPSFASTNSRDKLQNFRMQMAGHVSLPDSWHGDNNLYDWIETEPVEEALRPLGLMMARAALINDHKDSRKYGRNT